MQSAGLRALLYGLLCLGMTTEASAALFPCTEQGILDAIAAGGGPHTFDCAGSTTVVTSAEIVIGNDVILDGGGNLTLDGNDAHRVFSLSSDIITAELRNLGISRGLAFAGGGIISGGDLTLVGCTVSDSRATDFGGGIYNDGSLTVIESTITGNEANFGGGVYSLGGDVTLARTALVGNSSGPWGGGFAYDCAPASRAGYALIFNSTVSENLRCGVLDNCFGVAIVHSTFSGNLDEGEPCGLSAASGIFSLRGTIIDDGCTGPVDDLGYNLESGDSCGLADPTSQSETPALLGPLADNGGPTRTHLLLDGSPAVDAVPREDCVWDEARVLFDQRLHLRPKGLGCDIGSVEVPEPAHALLLATGALVLLGARRLHLGRAIPRS